MLAARRFRFSAKKWPPIERGNGSRHNRQIPYRRTKWQLAPGKVLFLCGAQRPQQETRFTGEAKGVSMRLNRILPFLAVIATLLIGAKVEAADPPASTGSPRWNVIDQSDAAMIKKAASLDRPVVLEDCLAATLGRPLTDREKAAVQVARRKASWTTDPGNRAYSAFLARVRKIDPNLKPVDVARAMWPEAPCFESYLVPGWEVLLGFRVRGLELTESMTKYVLQEERRLQAEMVPLAYVWTRTISEATGLSMGQVVEARRTEEKILREKIAAGVRERKAKSAK